MATRKKRAVSVGLVSYGPSGFAVEVCFKTPGYRWKGAFQPKECRLAWKDGRATLEEAQRQARRIQKDIGPSDYRQGRGTPRRG